MNYGAAQKYVNGKKTPEYLAWCSMHGRCRAGTPRTKRYYGSRGITVCTRWKSFDNFFADMGPKPSDSHSLDRVDNSKGYSPKNCRWATQPEQIKNSRRAHKITHDGRTKTIGDWAAEIGINSSALVRRVQKWGVEKALTTPVNTKFRNGNAGKKAVSA